MNASKQGDESLDIIERRLGHRFIHRELLLQALTHRSHCEANNERLEFLGDAVLGFGIADWLYRAFPDASEDQLTLMRASLVKRPALARVAREIELGQHLRLGVGERKSGGHRRDSILADALEALLGAVLQDAGYEAARAVITTLFDRHVAQVDAASARDNKTRLQELLQARGMALPSYVVMAEQGDAHAPQFIVACRIAEPKIVTQGQAKTRREAEQVAAGAALLAMERDHGR